MERRILINNCNRASFHQQSPCTLHTNETPKASAQKWIYDPVKDLTIQNIFEAVRMLVDIK